MATAMMKMTIDTEALDKITQLQCLNQNCKHRHAASFTCNLKHLTVGKSGECTTYAEKHHDHQQDAERPV